MEDSSPPPPKNITLTPLETIFPFPPHRRRPLRSRTYHALIGLLSHCHTNSHHVQIKDVDGGDIRLSPVSKENTSVKVNSKALIGPLSDSNQLKDTLVKETSISDDKENNGGFDCIQAPALVLDRINSVAHGDLNCNQEPASLLDCINTVADGGAELALENGISSVDSLVVENHTGDCAIQVSNEQDDTNTVLENPTIDHSVVVENQTGDCDIQVSNEQDDTNIVLDNPTVENQTGDCDIQVFNEKYNANTVLDNQPSDLGTLDDLIVDNDFSIADYSEILDSCFDMDMVIESSKTADDSNENVTVFEENMLKEAELALKLKEMELEKLIQGENAGEDIEEGEISGEADASVDALYEDTASLEKRSTEMVRDSNKEESMCDVEDRGYRKNEISDPSVINKANSDCNSTKMDSITTAGERRDCHSQTVFRDSHMENAAENQMAASLEKDGDAKSKKRKNPPLTKEEKAKKKKKDKLKRAETNRELGVKRLKLQPVSSTKSKPCGHFARNECMKGDNCPYDHQLSKYPCKNYSANGFCGRGSDCLFSHENLSTTPTPSKPKSKSAHHTITDKGIGLLSNVSKTILTPEKSNEMSSAPRKPQGINFLSFARPTPFDSSSEMFSKLISGSSDETRKSMKGGAALPLPLPLSLPSIESRPSKVEEPIKMRFLSFGGPSDQSNVSNSLKTSFLSTTAWKAAQSTLEFAANFEPSIKVGSLHPQSGC